MIRSMALLPLALVACGGNDGAATAPVENAGEADLALPVDEEVFDGDNLTAIDAAANDAEAQSLAADAVANDEAGNTAEAE
ncbi:hypothetical protein [Sphingomonas sp. IW22]|uniref:hypothetical protein n=1 Tax=Sphingomonas sp. IW22 TaxID=3242489 RepID=UPI003520D8CD